MWASCGGREPVELGFGVGHCDVLVALVNDHERILVVGKVLAVFEKMPLIIVVEGLLMPFLRSPVVVDTAAFWLVMSNITVLLLFRQLIPGPIR